MSHRSSQKAALIKNSVYRHGNANTGPARNHVLVQVRGGQERRRSTHTWGFVQGLYVARVVFAVPRAPVVYPRALGVQILWIPGSVAWSLRPPKGAPSGVPSDTFRVALSEGPTSRACRSIRLPLRSWRWPLCLSRSRTLSLTFASVILGRGHAPWGLVG